MRLVRLAILLSYSLTAVGLPAPGIGLLTTGEAAAPRAMALLETRVRRWLESEGEAGVVRPLGAADLELLREERERRRWEGELAALEGEPDWNRVGRVISRLPHTDRRAWGVVGVRALLWKAAWHLAEGRRAPARETLEAALRLSPETVPWPPALRPREGDPWGDLAAEALSRVKRDCRLRLPEEVDSLSLNGQWVRARGDVAVPSGVVHRLRWRGREREVDCLRPGLVAVDFGGGRGQPASLGDLGEGARHLCVIEAQGDRFRLHLYTEGVGLDEIPLRAPLSVEALMRDPLGSELPVDGEGFRRLRRSHTLWVQGPLGRMADGAVGGAAEPDGRWYNKWTTWAIGGALVAGALIAVLAHRPPSVRTQAHGGLRIQLE